MAPYAVSLTKKITWRGKDEQFSNVYHYDLSTVINTESGWDALINAIKNLEDDVHSSAVTYQQARVWGPTNQGPAASETRRILDLSGTGQMTVATRIYAEAAVVVQFYLGRNPATGRKRFLRKFFHSQGVPSSTSVDVSTGVGPLTSADKTLYVNTMNSLKTLTVGGFSHDICAPNGDHLPLNTSPQVLDHLHIRQFKQ
jgi:hypothetical protein